MNIFLMLKNELSLHFLREQENLVATVKCAIRLHISEAERERANEERLQMRIIDKILHNEPIPGDVGYDSEEEEKKQEPPTKKKSSTYVPTFDDATQKKIHDRLIKKLLEYN